MVTSMETPLGYAVGNALEVAEAIDTLAGTGPKDLSEEVMALASQILLMAGLADDSGQAIEILQDKIASGAALEKLEMMIRAQGGNPDVIRDRRLLPHSSRLVPVVAPGSGYVQSIDALAIGSIAMDLGAGRQAKGESISSSAGIVLREKPDPNSGSIEPGQVLAELHLPLEPDKLSRLPEIDQLQKRVQAAYVLGPEPAAERPVVLRIVDEGENE
jgi:pyrimidine-nucleoside phosphorylase